MAKNIRLSDHFTYSKLLRFTLPSIVMMVFTSIYGVVDGLFVSNFVGKTAFASVNLVMPFVMILGGMGFMIGTGGTALVSKILGEGDPDTANRTFSMMVLFTLALGIVLSAAGNGSSELMSNISSSVVSMLYNFQLMRLAGEDGVSAYGVLMYVQFIFISIYIGYSIGCAPVVSYHFGAQNHGELKNLLGKSVLLMGCTGVALTALAMALADPLSRLFVGYDAGLFALTSHAFRLFAWSFLLAGFNIYASGFFTALNNGGISAAISFLRTLVFQSASVLILPIFLDVDGIWWAITVAEVFAFLISVTFLLAKRGKYHYM